MKGDTLKDDTEWERFASQLIGSMSLPLGGIRGMIFLSTFAFPVLVLGGAAGLMLFSLRPVPMIAFIAAGIAVLASAYLCWHTVATEMLQRTYENILFGNAKPTLTDLKPDNLPRWCPILLINATGLNNGEHLAFGTGQSSETDKDLRSAYLQQASPEYALFRGLRSVIMPPETPLSRAIAASSAMPGVFAPLIFRNVLAKVSSSYRFRLWKGTGLKGAYHATDGGLFDNQGTYPLSKICEHLIVSDGAAALNEDLSPSSWPLWPPRKGLLFRANDIIYDRLRELGYIRLEERHNQLKILVNVLRGHGLPIEDISSIASKFAAENNIRFLASYAYVELNTRPNFPHVPGGQRLPVNLIPYVSTIRTDLDSFSLKEISALMFHGYTLIDNCVRAYQNQLLPKVLPPLKFAFPPGGIFSDWDNPTQEEIEKAKAHLAVSSSRFGTWRYLYRLLKNC